MIARLHALDRKIKESNIEEIYERLCIPKTDQSFTEILAEFGIEIRNNPLFEPYIKNIADTEIRYRQISEIASILQKATYTPIGQQALDQKMLARREQISEYFSVWKVLRFSELYDISSHTQVRAALITKNDARDRDDFEVGVIVSSDILEGNSNANLADYYLPLAHRVISGIIKFFDEQPLVPKQDQNRSYNSPAKLEISTGGQKSINFTPQGIGHTVKAEGLSFDECSATIQYAGKALVDLRREKDEVISFAAMFFLDGKLSATKLTVSDILKKLNPEPESLLAGKGSKTRESAKTKGDPDREHMRYLKNKLNALIRAHINGFIQLKYRKFFPNPQLFEK